MSWSNATDIDFHVWDVNGRHSFYRNLTAIPASVVSQDILVGSEWKSSLKVTTRADSLPYLVHPPRTHAIAPVRQIALTHSSSARSWVTDTLSTTGATEYAVRLSSTETAKPSRMSARSPNLNTEAVMSLRGSRAVPRFTSVLVRRQPQLGPRPPQDLVKPSSSRSPARIRMPPPPDIMGELPCRRHEALMTGQRRHSSPRPEAHMGQPYGFA
jgi:hypothetical protein